jgi:hypothetical protein
MTVRLCLLMMGWASPQQLSKLPVISAMLNCYWVLWRPVIVPCVGPVTSKTGSYTLVGVNTIRLLATSPLLRARLFSSLFPLVRRSSSVQPLWCCSIRPHKRCSLLWSFAYLPPLLWEELVVAAATMSRGVWRAMGDRDSEDQRWLIQWRMEESERRWGPI